MTDKLTVRIVVGVLGMVAVIVTAGGVWLADSGKSLPDALVALGSGALGAVSALLARTATQGPSDPS